MQRNGGRSDTDLPDRKIQKKDRKVTFEKRSAGDFNLKLIYNGEFDPGSG